MTAAGEAIRNDPGAIDILVENYHRFLGFLERRVGSREVAEDILHDSFLRGIHGAGAIRDRESVIAWFYRVLRNAVTDHHRSRGAEKRAHDRVLATADATEEPFDEELMQQVCGCVGDLIGTLKPSYAQALRRIELDGVAVQTFADEAGITANNASVRLHRARDALRHQVIRTCGTCGVHGCVDCSCRATSGG
jgi:RNA polymerase sigma factor (sigma-70 family)